MPFDEMIDSLEELEAGLDELVIDEARLAEDKILDDNRLNQLYDEGVDRNRRRLEGYAPSTIARKKRKGQPYDRTTLRDSGDFHSSMIIEYREKEFEITATDWKREILEARYGSAIFGLTDESLQHVIDLLREGIIDEARKIVFG
jgi:hypothetical protein